MYHINIKELVRIDIEIKKRSWIKEFSRKLYNKSEDMMFSIIQKLPERFIPGFFMEWVEKYLDKRINELKQESIKMTWRNIYLQDAANEIHSRQQDIEKAPSDN